MKLILLLPLLFTIIPVFAESHPEYFEIEKPSTYTVNIDEHTFLINYQVDADVLAMAIDKETHSFLIGLDNAKDSVMTIDLEHKMINAQNNDYVILVNGVEVDYEIVNDADSSTFSFIVPEFTEEIEIIGTFVIPEFPLGVILIFSALVTVVAIITRKTRLF